MIKKESKNVSRLKRHARIRKNLSGTSEMPRLNVFRSNTAASILTKLEVSNKDGNNNKSLLL